DVDVLDGVFELHVGFGHGGLERVEVDHHQIDQADAVFLGGSEVVRLVAAAEQTAVDLGMQGLDAPFHHLGKAGVFADLGHGQVFVGQQLGGAAGREELVAVLPHEGGGKVHESLFVADGKESQFFHKDGSSWFGRANRQASTARVRRER